MGDGHQEAPLALRSLRETLGHLAEPVGEMGDLVPRPNPWQLDVVAPLRHLVRGCRECEHRLREPSREVPEESGSDDQAAEERKPDTPDEHQPPVAELCLRLRDDERAERLAAERDRFDDRHEGPILSRRRELDPGRRLGQSFEACVGLTQLTEARRLAREDLDPDVVQVRSRRLLELRRSEARRRRSLVDALKRLLLVQVGEPSGLPPEVVHGLVDDVVLKEAHGDDRRHEPGDQHAENEEGRYAEAERPHRFEGTAPLDGRRLRLRRDLVPHSPHRHDRAGVAELPPELADVNVDRARVTGERVAPHALEQLITRQHEPAMVEELPEEVELLRCELNLGARDDRLPAP